MRFARSMRMLRLSTEEVSSRNVFHTSPRNYGKSRDHHAEPARKAQRHFHANDGGASNGARPNREEPCAGGHYDRQWQSVLRRYGFGHARGHRKTISRGKPGRLTADCENVSPHLELSPAADRRCKRPGLRWRLRYCNTLRFHARRAGSEVRIHGSKNRLPSSDCFRVSDAADRRETLPRPAAYRSYHRSSGGEGIRPGIRNCSRRTPAGTRARTCEPADCRKSQQPYSFQTPSGLLGGGWSGSRFGTRHPGKRPNSLHARFPGRTRFVFGEAQAGVAERFGKIRTCE